MFKAQESSKQLVQLVVAQRRMTIETNDERYEAIAQEFDRLKKERKAADKALEARQRTVSGTKGSPDSEADAALALLDNVVSLTDNDRARADINPLLRTLGLWIGLTFKGG